MQICGIDPSMNSTGKCVMELDDTTFAIKSMKFYGYNSVNSRCLNGDNVILTSVGSKYLKDNMFNRQNIAYEIIAKYSEDIVQEKFGTFITVKGSDT